MCPPDRSNSEITVQEDADTWKILLNNIPLFFIVVASFNFLFSNINCFKVKFTYYKSAQPECLDRQTSNCNILERYYPKAVEERSNLLWRPNTLKLMSALNKPLLVGILISPLHFSV